MRNYKELFRMTLMMLLEVALLEYQMQQTMLKTYAISFERWKEQDEIADNDYIKKYYKEYKELLLVRNVFLGIQEKRLNAILYKNMSLDEIRKELNPEKKTT